MRDWIIAWLAEKSTWAGLITLAIALGSNVSPEVQNALVPLAASLFAMPDRK